MVPEDVRYTAEHEWVQATGTGTVRVGITHFAQDALGDIVYVSLPAVGSQLTAGAACGEVESTTQSSRCTVGAGQLFWKVVTANAHCPVCWLCTVMPRMPTRCCAPPHMVMATVLPNDPTAGVNTGLPSPTSVNVCGVDTDAPT